MTNDEADQAETPDRDPVTGRLLPGHDAGGAPSPFREEFIDQARKLAARGLIDVEIADFFGVTDRTVRNWKIRHPEFADALKVGKGIPDDNVERSFYKSSIGYEVIEQEAVKIRIQEKPGTFREEVVVVDVTKHVPPNPQSSFRWLLNRRPEDWREKVTHEHTGKDGGPIATIDLSDLNEEQLRALASIKLPGE